MNQEKESLFEVKKGEKIKILEILEEGPLKIRLLELGLIRNTIVRVLRVAPFHSEMAIALRNYELCLPQSVLKKILVERIK